jgi:hypothetical protein
MDWVPGRTWGWLGPSGSLCNELSSSLLLLLLLTLVFLQRNAEALSLGVRAICYELNASKDEVRLALAWL